MELLQVGDEINVCTCVCLCAFGCVCLCLCVHLGVYVVLCAVYVCARLCVVYVCARLCVVYVCVLGCVQCGPQYTCYMHFHVPLCSTN